MKDRPVGVTEFQLAQALRDGWGLAIRSTEYLPVGAGSYHWAVVDDSGRKWFATVDALGGPGPGPGAAAGSTAGAGAGSREASFQTLGRALDTAARLRRDAGLGFVVAPTPTRTGSSVWRLDEWYAISVFPMVQGKAGEFGRHPPGDRAEVLELLIELHRATPMVAAGTPRSDLVLPGRDGLQDALDDLDRKWGGGPYAEPARRLLARRADHIARLLGDFDRLVADVRRSRAAWVVTHGEPHPGNVMRTGDGLKLIDWDTVRIAPPERDLWLVVEDGDDLLVSYGRAAGHLVDPAGLALYRLWWELADIASFVTELRQPHHATEDSAASWTYLNSYLD